MLPSLPTAVLEEVFFNISAHEVVCICRLVCHQWKEIVDSTSYWRERCRREGLKLRDRNKCPEDWSQFYILSKNRKNLLKNPRADEMFTGWRIMLNGGDGWKIEDVALNFPDEGVKKYFVTSFGSCKKSQLIDVVSEGYGPHLMDEIQPDIVISDWFSPRWDCGCVYEICVELLDQEQRVIETFCPDPVSFPQWNEMQWQRSLPGATQPALFHCRTGIRQYPRDTNYDDPYIPRLRARRPLHQVHSRWTGHPVLGGLVWDPGH
ncbi:F-box only protein 6-like isoform X1 [Brienomyrus brachyistius]|uniref:F-box only protein 6-like isoform X1 n=1 Tax=Brienomyrus brachyistius TaxID=42636 RepID=UPI0020B37BFB|nr:F-box only protein 6-like isoform X1 [Brienomyrus brachyistius]